MKLIKGILGGQQYYFEKGYHKITIEIQKGGSLPKFQYTENLNYQQTIFSQSHPSFRQYFPDQQKLNTDQNNYDIYLTKKQETLMGLSLKFNTGVQKLKQINQIGDEIFPQMKLKIPKGKIPLQQTEFKEEEQVINFKDIFYKNYKSQSHKCITFLQMRQYFLLAFTIQRDFQFPNLEDQDNLQQVQRKKLLIGQKLLKFNAIIQIQDLKEVIAVNYSNDNLSYSLQFLLYSVGNKNIVKKYHEKLRNLRKKNLPIASIFFIINNKNKSNETSQKQWKTLFSQINQYIKNKPQLTEQKNSLTNLPYFDIMYESIGSKEYQNTWEVLKFIPKMIDKSFFLNQDIFLSIITNVPNLYKMHDWKLIYCPHRDGTSLNSLIKLTQQCSPILLIIKEYKNTIFGAYCTDSLRMSFEQLFGKGEMFLFSNKDGTMKYYNWSKKNKFFMLIDEQGIAIGMGDKYGLYIRRNLQNGSSHPTLTFDSPCLTQEEQFEIQFLQIWTIQC